MVDIYHFHHFFYSFTTRYWLFWFVTRRWRPGMLSRTRPNETAFLKRWNDVPTALERRSKAAGTFLLRLRNDYLRLSVVETLLVALITRRFVAELGEDMGKAPRHLFWICRAESPALLTVGRNLVEIESFFLQDVIFSCKRFGISLQRQKKIN